MLPTSGFRVKGFDVTNTEVQKYRMNFTLELQLKQQIEEISLIFPARINTTPKDFILMITYNAGHYCMGVVFVSVLFKTQQGPVPRCVFINYMHTMDRCLQKIFFMYQYLL